MDEEYDETVIYKNNFRWLFLLLSLFIIIWDNFHTIWQCSNDIEI